ncbi:MAG: apolipoprotein N-acyltransferase [Desulfotignum sp.]|nr:apolipoprotein N-acyltransferase [Desulfotignum sp.]
MPVLYFFFPAMVSGLLLTLSFPDADLYYLGFIALAPLIVSLSTLTARQGFIAGLAAGFIHFITLIYWIVPTLCTFGGLHPVPAVAALILLCLYLSLYPALFAFGLNKLAPHPALMPLAAAALWTGLEWVRSCLFTGFPWGLLGYSQAGNRWMIQMADVTGVYGVSFLLVLCSAMTAMGWQYIMAKQRSGYPGNSASGIPFFIGFGYTLMLLAAAYGYAMFRLPDLEKKVVQAPEIRLAIIQGNIAQGMKWDMAFRKNTIEKYGVMSLEAARLQTDLIIWPETALPFYYGQNTLLSNQVDDYIRQASTHFLIGTPAVDTSHDPVRYYNRVLMLTPLALPEGSYDKTHLVPFGEYVPFQDLLFFIEKLTAEAGNFSGGEPVFTPLAFKTHHTGVLICFEILFPDISRQFVKKGADLLTTVTNDAWFGHTSAAAQHFAVAVFRAVENRRSLARAANTGISGFIDPTGRVFDTTALFTDAVIVRSMPALTHISLYTRYGDLFTGICLIALGMGFVVKIRQYFKRRYQP